MRKSITFLLIALVSLSTAPLSHAQEQTPNPAPTAVSARRMLNASLPGIAFENTPLEDVLGFVRDLTGVSLYVQWPALEEVGVFRDTPVNLKLSRVQVRTALDLVLRSVSPEIPLTFYVEDNVLFVTTQAKADEKLFTVVYDVRDLIVDVPNFYGEPEFDLGGNGNGGGGSGQSGGGRSLFGGSGNGNNEDQADGRSREERIQDLINLITTVVRPDIWQVNGGPAAIEFFNGNLVITAPRSVHELIDGPIGI